MVCAGLSFDFKFRSCVPGATISLQSRIAPSHLVAVRRDVSGVTFAISIMTVIGSFG